MQLEEECQMPPAALRGIYFALRREDFTHYGQRHEGKGQHILYCMLPPHVFVTSHGARVASQQLPYPPDWRRDSTMILWNSKKNLARKEVVTARFDKEIQKNVA
jgi:hypothetical protein